MLKRNSIPQPYWGYYYLVPGGMYRKLSKIGIHVGKWEVINVGISKEPWERPRGKYENDEWFREMLKGQFAYIVDPIAEGAPITFKEANEQWEQPNIRRLYPRFNIVHKPKHRVMEPLAPAPFRKLSRPLQRKTKKAALYWIAASSAWMIGSIALFITRNIS